MGEEEIFRGDKTLSMTMGFNNGFKVPYYPKIIGTLTIYENKNDNEFIVDRSYIQARFRNYGLGKMFYSNFIKRYGSLSTDFDCSTSARRVWVSLIREYRFSIKTKMFHESRRDLTVLTLLTVYNKKRKKKLTKNQALKTLNNGVTTMI